MERSAMRDRLSKWHDPGFRSASSGLRSTRTANAPPARLGGGGRPLVSSRFPQKRGGAERRQALVRNAAPDDPPHGKVDLRIAGDHRRDTPTGAPLDALLRL